LGRSTRGCADPRGAEAGRPSIADGLQRARVGAKVTPHVAEVRPPVADMKAGQAINQPILAMVLSIVLLTRRDRLHHAAGLGISGQR
jgi:hypothetical protein